jgi:hypothetical protein
MLEVLGQVEDKKQRKFGNALRDDKSDKINYSLGIHPLVLKRIAKHMTNASYEAGGKYPKWNWTGGMPAWQCLESLERHLSQYKLGEVDEDHLISVLFNVMNLVYNEEIEKMDPIELEVFEEHMRAIYGENYCGYKKEKN